MEEIEEGMEICRKCGYRMTPNISRGLQPQTILNGKYMIGKIIGEGGFGITYIAYDLVLEKCIAIKEYFPSDMVARDTTVGSKASLALLTGKSEHQYKKGLEKFAKEAENLARFNNLPGIVSVKDFFYENNTAYMVMEYIDGITLSQYLSQHGNKLPYDQVINLMKPVMESLQTVHEADIIHRDISPDNIMITKDGEMKLIDFGAARFVGNDDAKSLTVILKHGYAPPEQYQTDGEQGTWTDVYALASTMYRMITGEVPQEATERMILQNKLQPLKSCIKDIPLSISDAIQHAMELRHDKRIQNIKDFQRALYKTAGVSKFVWGIAVLSFIAVVGVSVICILRPNNKKDERIVPESNEITEIVISEDGSDILSPEHDINNTVYTEEEMYSLVTEKGGTEPITSCYRDFDQDGLSELFAIMSVAGKDKEYRLWYVEDDGSIGMYEDRRKEQMQGDIRETKVLQFSNAEHYYVELDKDDGEIASFSFGYKDGAVTEIYSGEAILSNKDDKVYSCEVENKRDDTTGEWISLNKDCEILFEDGIYTGMGYNILTWKEICDKEGGKEAIEQGLKDISQLDFEYSYHVPTMAYYCSNEHIYLAFKGLKSENEYIKSQDDLYPWKSRWGDSDDFMFGVDRFDYIKYEKYVDLIYDKDTIIYNGIVDSIPPLSNLFNNKCRLFKPNSYETETWSDSEDSLKRILAEHVGFLDNENLVWDYEEAYGDWGIYGYHPKSFIEYLYDDFDADGKNELYALIILADKRVRPYFGTEYIYGVIWETCCVDENGVATMELRLESNTEYTFHEESFGKTKLCIYEENSIHQDYIGSEAYELQGDDVYVVDILDGSHIEKDRSRYGGDLLGTNFAVTEMTLWYIDREFVECASIEIDMDRFLEYDGADSIIQEINDIVYSNMKEQYREMLSKAVSYSVENILYSGDYYIYLNCRPNADSSIDHSESYYYDEYVTVRLKIDGKSVEYVDQQWGERGCRVSPYKAYYPILEE